MSLKAFYAEDFEHPEEGGCIIIARDEAEAMQHAVKSLRAMREAIDLFTTNTACGEVRERLEALNDAMQKAADAARAEEREACALEADRFVRIASEYDTDEDDYQRGVLHCAQTLSGRIRARSKESKP